jgi:hypothetical protein
MACLPLYANCINLVTSCQATIFILCLRPAKAFSGRTDGQTGIITKSASFQVDEYSLSGPMS